MEADKTKWNARFLSEDWFLGKHPSRFLEEEIERIKMLLTGRSALDIACGEGRNSLFLAKHGFSVTGVDISDVGLNKARRRANEEGLDIVFAEADLDSYEIEGKYDLIVNFNFLSRPLIEKAFEALRPGGVLLIDTIMESPSLVRQHNPDYLLKKGELMGMVSNWEGEIVRTEEIKEGDMPTARMFFRKSL